MYILSTELEPSDIQFFGDTYDILGINRACSEDNAFQDMMNDLKQKRKPFLFLATRKFDKVYRFCVIHKVSKPKEEIFDNQIEYIQTEITHYIHTKCHKLTYLFTKPDFWDSTVEWDVNYLKSFTKPNHIYKLEGDFKSYCTRYLLSPLNFAANVIQTSCDLIKYNQPLPLTLFPRQTFLTTTVFPVAMSENCTYGINSKHCSHPMLPNSYIFTSDGNGIYGMIRVTHVQTVDRINRQRFIQNYAVIPLHYNWDTEIQIDIATYTKHINNKELWGVQLEAFETFFKSLNVPPFLIEKIDSGFLNTYIDSYESLPEQPEVPLEESTATYNAFVDLAPVITGLNRIYILTTSNVNKFYTKLTINDEDCIFLDLTPSYFFKVNTKKWNTNITKQFLEDIRLDQAHILLMTKGAKQFFMSLKVTYLQKYKSQKDMVSSITPIAWPLDYPCDSDMYGLYGVLPFMIKSKQAWGEFGQNVKHFDEISHVLKNIPERTLQVFSNTDQGDKLEMFNYLRTYLTYEAFARANNQFIDFTREQIEQWSDTIHPRDYGLRLRLYWDSL